MRTVSLLLVSLLLSVGCKPELLPNTNVEDNKENRAVVDFVDDYRKAMENRDADELLKLVAEEYFEDRGTVDQEDDYGIEKLRADLVKRFEHTKALQLTLFVQHVERGDADDRIRVYYRYLQRALLDLPAGRQWVSHSDVNRLDLKLKGDNYADGFLIVSGL